MGDIVLQTPQPPVGRYKDEKAAARLEHSRKLTKRGYVVVEVLQHIQRRHNVKSVRGEWKLKDVCILDVDQSASAAKLESLVRNVNPANAPQMAQLLQHQAGSTAGVQNVEIIPISVPLPYPVQDDVAPRREPPVGGFGVIQDLIGVSFQPAVFNQPGSQFDQASIISPFVSSGLGRA